MAGPVETVLLRPRGEPRGRIPGAGTFGLALFLTSLGVFFAAALAGFLWVRLRADAWPPPGTPSLPRGLWWGTLVLAGASAAIQWALAGIRRGDARTLRYGSLGAAVLAILFLALQASNWWSLLAAELTARTSLFGFTFYVLTGLHAVHVVGGLVPLAVVTARAWRGGYSWADYAGVRHCAVYWHFLGAVWLVTFAALVVLS